MLISFSVRHSLLTTMDVGLDWTQESGAPWGQALWRNWSHVHRLTGHGGRPGKRVQVPCTSRVLFLFGSFFPMDVPRNSRCDTRTVSVCVRVFVRLSVCHVNITELRRGKKSPLAITRHTGDRISSITFEHEQTYTQIVTFFIIKGLVGCRLRQKLNSKILFTKMWLPLLHSEMYSFKHQHAQK